MGLQGHAIEDNMDVHWVITVPAIWSDAAKQFMTEAATKVPLAFSALCWHSRHIVTSWLHAVAANLAILRLKKIRSLNHSHTLYEYLLQQVKQHMVSGWDRRKQPESCPGARGSGRVLSPLAPRPAGTGCHERRLPTWQQVHGHRFGRHVLNIDYRTFIIRLKITI